jgi:ketosteroid isomerase-like protein
VTEERIQELVGRFDEAFQSRNVEEMLTLFADDAIWVSPVGTFEGADGLRRVLTWDTKISPTVRFERSGIGLLVKGNVAVGEAMSEGTLYDGKKWDAPAVTIFEFGDDEKIRRIRLYYDRLSMSKRVVMQDTGVEGWIAQKVMNAIVARAETGLH